MTEKMIENRIKKLQAIEAQREELEAAADAMTASPCPRRSGRGWRCPS